MEIINYMKFILESIARPSLDLKALKRNIKTIAEGLARYIYDIPESDDHPVFSGSLVRHPTG